MQTILLKNIDAVYHSSGHESHGTDILIESNKIVQSGTNLRPGPVARVVPCSGKVALPGLLNAHHHFFQILTRCLPGGQDAALFDWLTYHYPVWLHFNSDAFRAAFRFAISELLLTGCTTTSDHHYLFPQGMDEDPLALQIEAARELGIRYVGTRGSMTLGKSRGGLPPDELCEDDEKVLVHSEESLNRYHDAGEFSMCQVHLAPCSPFNVTRELMIQSARLARKYGVRLHTHLAETSDEARFCEHRYGLSPLALMEEVEWLGRDVWFAHGIHFSDSDLNLLARAQSGICHCPSSNMRLASGAARIPEMLLKGIPVGLGVDGSASNDSSDMIGELRQALLLSRHEFGVKSMTARKVIELGTSGSAELLGRTTLGRIEPGCAADIALFDIDQLGYAGAADPIAGLIFAGFERRAWMVIVNGKPVVEDGQLLSATEASVKDEANAQARNLWQRAGIL